MTSLSHREFTDSLITQKLILCQIVDFFYNVVTYDTNMESKLWSLTVEIFRHRYTTKFKNLHNSVNTRDKAMKFESQIHLNGVRVKRLKFRNSKFSHKNVSKRLN